MLCLSIALAQDVKDGAASGQKVAGCHTKHEERAAEGLGEPESSKPIETPLQQALRLYESKLNLALKHRLRLAFSKAIERLDKQKMSSACSGCDIAYICATLMVKFWADQIGEPCAILHGFACEHQKEKQLFLQTQFQLGELFNDVADLGKVRATNIMTGRAAFVGGCFLFTAGFSCRSRTPLSCKSSANRNCLQNHQSDAETSYTFDHILSYIQRHSPTICILENVPALLQRDSQAANALSDADWVIAQLEEAGYLARYWKFGAEDFGSRAARVRVYFIAWCLPRLEKPVSPGVRAKLCDKVAWLERLFHSMTIEPLPASAFINFVQDPLEAEALFFEGWDSHTNPKCRKLEPKWQDEHCSAFRAASLTWPMPDHGRVVSLKGGSMFKLYLNERASELLFYLHAVFPLDDENIEPQFCDVNPTLSRCTQNGSPWRSICPTITGASQICVRYRHGGFTVLRPLSGRECMALIGWHESYYSPSVTMDDVLLRNFAGNAFSGFAVLPMMLLAVAGWQTIDGYEVTAEDMAELAKLRKQAPDEEGEMTESD